jgi:hypothetical protein
MFAAKVHCVVDFGESSRWFQKVCFVVSGCGFHLSKLYALPGVWGFSYQFAFVTVSILKLSGICFASSTKISIMEVILALKTALLQV